MRLALLGGSFNPVHRGHVSLASSVIGLLPYDRILIIPALMSPHKRGSFYTDPEHRINMLKLAFGDKAWAEICRCEIEREGPSYTVDTIEYVYRNFRFEGKPGLIVGDDWIENFSHWKDVEKIVERTDLIVARREEGDGKFPYPCSYLRNDVVSVSSTEIRQYRREGKPVDALVPSQVAEYMEKNGLYRS